MASSKSRKIGVKLAEGKRAKTGVEKQERGKGKKGKRESVRLSFATDESTDFPFLLLRFYFRACTSMTAL